MEKHQLIGSEVSLYTGKLRCYLDYKAIPYEEVLSTANVFKEVIVPRTGVRYIPILITDDDVALQDTTEIIDFLEKRYPEHSVYPATPLQNLVSLLFEVYGDEWLVIPAMHYRWSFQENIDFARGEFGRTSAPELNQEQRYEMGKELSKPFAGALPRLGVNEATIPGVEKSYTALLSELNAHFSEHAYLLGDRPCMGDLGLIGPLYAHLYRDPYSGRMMEELAPAVVAWVKRMVKPTPQSGDFYDQDQVLPTLLPILARMVKEQGPVLEQTIQQVEAWAANNSESEIPRAIGNCQFTLEGVEGERLTFPYMQWMWQRVYDFYHALNSDQKESVDQQLQSVEGLKALLDTPIKQRVERVENKLLVVR